MDGAQLLASYLERVDVDREALAAKVGTVPDMLYQWATGVRRPNGDNRFALEDATGGAVPARSWSEPTSKQQKRRKQYRAAG